MSHSYLLNTISLFIKRHKFFSISFLVIIILIPTLVFAINNRLDGYRVPASKTLYTISYTNPSGDAATPMVAIQNDSSVDYFVPTKTWNEWSAFYSGQSRLGVAVKDYCGGGVCETATENCDNCPQDCCISGCEFPDWCVNKTIYFNSKDCGATGSSMAGIIANVCINDSSLVVDSTGHITGCSSYGYTSELFTNPTGVCTHPQSIANGCAAGYVCRNVDAYHDSTNCSDYIDLTANSVCVPSTTPLGCVSYTDCIPDQTPQGCTNANASLYYTTATGCTH